MKGIFCKKNNRKILCLITIAFWGMFYYFLPFAGDDWAWGSEIGIERLKSLFDGYNGRYLGNLLIIAITRSVIFKVVFCTFVMSLLILILSKIFDNFSNCKKSTTNYIIAFSSVLVLVLPNQIAFGKLQPFQIFGSTIGWLSGFANYVVPSLLILIFYYFVTKKEYENKLIYIFLVFDGILACLCVEHYTLFCILFSFSIIVYRYYFFRKICRKSLFFLLGSLIGTSIMFQNSSYRLMQKGNVSNNLRAVGFIGSLKNYAGYIFPKNTNKLIIIIFGIILSIAILSFFIFFFFKVYKAIKNKNIAKLLPIICIVAMTLPLLFTNSGREIYVIAPRCYFLQYFMLVIYIYNNYTEKNKQKNLFNNNKFKQRIGLSFVLLIFITSVNYCLLDYAGVVRDNTVNKSLEGKKSTVEIIAYPKYIEHIQWASNFIEEEVYIKRYKKFKNIPDNNEIEIKILKFDSDFM